MILHKDFVKLVKGFNNLLKRDTVFGLHVGLYIGTPCEGDTQKVLVELESGMQIYAKVLYTFPFMGIPSEAWVAKYNDPLFCYVGFEQGKMERPIIVGFFFKTAKVSELPNPDYPDQVIAHFQNFEISVNDKTQVLNITKFDDEGAVQQIVKIEEGTILLDNVEKKQSVKISDKIQIGAQKSLEKSVLGETLKKVLTDALTDLGNISGIPTPAGPSGPLKSAPNFKLITEKIVKTFDSFLSKNVEND